MARISLAFSAWCNGRLKLKHITVRLDKLPTNTDTAVGKQRKGTSAIGTVFWQCIEWLILRDWCGLVCATFYLFVAQSSWRFEGRCGPQTAERPGLANLWWFQGATTDAAEAALVMWVSGGADHAHWFTICVLHWTRQKEAKQILENYCACVVKHESAVCHFLVFTPGNCVGFTFGTVLNLCIRVSVSVLTFEMVLAGLPPLVKGWRCSSHSCNSWALLQNTVMRSIMLPAANKTTRNKWRAAFHHRCYIQRLHRLMMGMNVLRTMRKVKWLSEALRLSVSGGVFRNSPGTTNAQACHEQGTLYIAMDWKGANLEKKALPGKTDVFSGQRLQFPLLPTWTSQMSSGSKFYGMMGKRLHYSATMIRGMYQL